MSQAENRGKRESEDRKETSVKQMGNLSQGFLPLRDPILGKEAASN